MEAHGKVSWEREYVDHKRESERMHRSSSGHLYPYHAVTFSEIT